MNIIYIGTYATKTLHQMFDTCFLHVCSRCAEKVVCYKHKSTIGYLYDTDKEYHYLGNVSIKQIFLLLNKRSKYWEIVRTLFSACQNVRLYFKGDKDSIVVYNYNNVFSLHVVNMLNKWKHRKVIVACHGEMDLLQKTEGGILSKVYRVILRDFFFKTKIEKNMQFVVLGDSILDNLRGILPSTTIEHIHTIDHPYYLPKTEKVIPITNEKPIHLGLVGTLTASKGLLSFMELMERLDHKGVECTYSIAGRVNTHEYDEFMQKHNVNIVWGYLPRNEYEDMIREFDAVLFFYPSHTYKLIASGAIFDAVAMNKPILTLRNDFFEYALTKSQYPSALFDNVEQMVNYISDGKLKDLYNNDFSLGKSFFDPNVVAKKFEVILNNLN